jgi:ElaB/YqjD/DUF883 family membrane-anchored ribosome-binding protein
MGEGQGQERTELNDDPERAAAQLRSEIEDVRDDLGDTAAALAAKTDVKSRAKEKADEFKRSARAKKDDLLSSSGRSPSGDSTNGGAAASSGLERVRMTVRQNPVPTAALGALVGGFLLGRLTRREP